MMINISINFRPHISKNGLEKQGGGDGIHPPQVLTASKVLGEIGLRFALAVKTSQIMCGI